MTKTKNELSTITSYFKLYKFQTNLDDAHVTSSSIEKAAYVDDDNDDETVPWVPHEWSSECSIRAKELLEKHLNKSDIIQNHPPSKGQLLVKKYEEEASENWDHFYETHKTNFFKDRHYLHKAFPNEFDCVYDIEKWNKIHGDFHIVEIGCGVGNTVLPLLERGKMFYVTDATKSNGCIIDKKKLKVWGFDFSSVAIDLLKKDERFYDAKEEDRVEAMVWDITSSPPPCVVEANISLLLFCLSAISPGQKMIQAVKHVASTLQPGGMLLLRDYGRYDEAQLKLGSSRAKRLSDNFYVKHDGTRCYYFTLEDLEELFVTHAKLLLVESHYVTRVYTNRSQGALRRRVWVQARFRKPSNNMSES